MPGNRLVVELDAGNRLVEKELREDFGENLAEKVYVCKMRKGETTLLLIYRSLSR